MKIFFDVSAVLIAIIVLYASPGLEKLGAVLPLLYPVYIHFSDTPLANSVSKEQSVILIFAILLIALAIIVHKNTYWINGKVLLPDNSPAVGARVVINDSSQYRTTSSDGGYDFFFFPLEDTTGLLFNVVYPGYTLSLEENLQNLNPDGNDLYLVRK